MKFLRAFTCSLAALTFSAIAHAAPVQYQITAIHALETYNDGSPVSANDYFFVDGTTITATFYYDSTSHAAYTNGDDPMGGDGLASLYPQALSNFSLEVNGQSIYALSNLLVVIDSQNTSPSSQDKIGISISTSSSSNSPSNRLTFGDFKLFNITIGIFGSVDMLPNQSLPDTLVGLNSSNIIIALNFSTPNLVHGVGFNNVNISQVPLPSSALFFLSGLIGLGANIFKKANK